MGKGYAYTQLYDVFESDCQQVVALAPRSRLFSCKSITCVKQVLRALFITTGNQSSNFLGVAKSLAKEFSFDLAFVVFELLIVIAMFHTLLIVVKRINNEVEKRFLIWKKVLYRNDDDYNRTSTTSSQTRHLGNEHNIDKNVQCSIASALAASLKKGKFPSSHTQVEDRKFVDTKSLASQTNDSALRMLSDCTQTKIIKKADTCCSSVQTECNTKSSVASQTIVRSKTLQIPKLNCNVKVVEACSVVTNSKSLQAVIKKTDLPSTKNSHIPKPRTANTISKYTDSVSKLNCKVLYQSVDKQKDRNLSDVSIQGISNQYTAIKIPKFEPKQTLATEMCNRKSNPISTVEGTKQTCLKNKSNLSNKMLETNWEIAEKEGNPAQNLSHRIIKNKVGESERRNNQSVI